MIDLLISHLSLKEIGSIEDINKIIFTYIQEIKADMELDLEYYALHRYPVSFDHQSFINYSVRQKNKILRAIEAKYPDWKEMVETKYENMRGRFTESGKCKLPIIMRNVEFAIKYPEDLSNGNARVTIIMFVSGRKSRYYHSIGKFNFRLSP